MFHFGRFPDHRMYIVGLKQKLQSDTGSVLLESIPDITIEVIITAKQQTTALWERYGRDTADDVVMRVHSDLLVRAYVKQPAGGVVRTGRECKPTRKELLQRTAQRNYTVFQSKMFALLIVL